MSLDDALKELGDWGMTYLAEFMIAGMLLVAGVLLGWLLQAVAQTLLRSLGLDGFAERSGMAAMLRQAAKTEQSVAKISGRIVFWSVFLFFLASALETVGMPRVAEYMMQIGAYLPRVLAALLLIIVGIFGGRMCRELFTAERYRQGDPKTWQRVAQSTQAFVVAAAVLLALTVLGLDLMPLLWLLGALVLAVGVLAAVGWGPLLRERSNAWLAARWLRNQVSVGDQIRLGEIEGTVAAVGDARLTLRTADGLVYLPHAAVSQQALMVLNTQSAEEVELPSFP